MQICDSCHGALSPTQRRELHSFPALPPFSVINVDDLAIYDWGYASYERLMHVAVGGRLSTAPILQRICLDICTWLFPLLMQMVLFDDSLSQSRLLFYRHGSK
jgi:hypothetical protein